MSLMIKLFLNLVLIISLSPLAVFANSEGEGCTLTDSSGNSNCDSGLTCDVGGAVTAGKKGVCREKPIWKSGQREEPKEEPCVGVSSLTSGFERGILNPWNPINTGPMGLTQMFFGRNRPLMQWVLNKNGGGGNESKKTRTACRWACVLPSGEKDFVRHNYCDQLGGERVLVC